MEVQSPWLRARGRLFDVCSDVNDDNLPAVGLRLSATCSTSSVNADELHLYVTELLEISKMNAIFGCLCLLKVGGEEEQQQFYRSSDEVPWTKTTTSSEQKCQATKPQARDNDFFSRELSVGSEVSRRSPICVEQHCEFNDEEKLTIMNHAEDLRAKKSVLKQLLRNYVSRSNFRYISRNLLSKISLASHTRVRADLDGMSCTPANLYECLANQLKSNSGRLNYNSGRSLLSWRPRKAQMRLPPRPQSLIQDVDAGNSSSPHARGRRYTAPEDTMPDGYINVHPAAPDLLPDRSVFKYFSPRFLNLIGIYDASRERSAQSLYHVSTRAALKSVFVKSLTQLSASCSDDRIYRIHEYIHQLSDYEIIKSIHRMSCYSTLLVESTQQQFKEVDMSNLIWINSRAKNSVEMVTLTGSAIHDKNVGLCSESRSLPDNKIAPCPSANVGVCTIQTRMCYPLCWYIEYSLLYFICLVFPELAPVSGGRSVKPPVERWLEARKVFRGILAICDILQNYYAKARSHSCNYSVSVRVKSEAESPDLDTAVVTTDSVSDSFDTHMALFKRDHRSTRSNSTDDGTSTSESCCGVEEYSDSCQRRDQAAVRGQAEGDGGYANLNSRSSEGSPSLPLLELSAQQNELVISEEIFVCIEEAAEPLENHFRAICRWPINPDILLKHVEEFLELPCIRTNQVDAEWEDFLQHCIGSLDALGERDDQVSGSSRESLEPDNLERDHSSRTSDHEYFAKWRRSMYTKLSTNFHNTLLHYYDRLSARKRQQSITLRMAESCVRHLKLTRESDNCFGPPQIPLRGSMVRTGQRSDPTLLLPFVAADILINLKRCARILFKHNYGDGGYNLWMHQRLRDCCHIVDMLAAFEQHRPLNLPPKHACPWLNFRKLVSSTKKQEQSYQIPEDNLFQDLYQVSKIHKKVSTTICDLLTSHIRGDVFSTTFRLQWSVVRIALTYHEAEILRSFNIAYDNVGGTLRNVTTGDMSPPMEAALEEVCVSVICRWLDVILNELRNLLSWNFLSNKILTEPSETPPLDNVTQWLHQSSYSR